MSRVNPSFRLPPLPVGFIQKEHNNLDVLPNGHCPPLQQPFLFVPPPAHPSLILSPKTPKKSSPLVLSTFSTKFLSSFQMAPSQANGPKCPIFPFNSPLFPLLCLAISLLSASAQEPSAPSNQPPEDGGGSSSSSASSSSFVLADPNSGAPQSAFSPALDSSPSLAPSGTISPQNEAQILSSSAPASPPNAAIGGYGSLMASPPSMDLLGSPMNDSPQTQDQSQQSARMTDPNSAKRHQFSQYAVPAAPAIPMPEPAGLVPGVGLAPAGPVPAAGTCPGGASLPIECDPKRPWPQCPPQSYCYATNTVDIGPYFCCPIWSTYGAAWRPATPFYSYAPPPPPNWPEPMRMAAAPAYGGPMAPIRKGRKEQRFDDDGQPLMTEEEQRKILQVMNDWVERQKTGGEPSKEGAAEGEERGPQGTAEENAKI